MQDSQDEEKQENKENVSDVLFKDLPFDKRI